MKKFFSIISAILCYGFFGGWLVATIVISYTYILGNLGETIEDFQDFWDFVALIGLGMLYGAPCGIVLLLIARLVMLKIDKNDFIRISIKCSFISIIFGCIGGFRGPFVAALVCIASFLFAVILWPYSSRTVK